MADYSEAYNFTPVPRFTPEEHGTKYRWDNIVTPPTDNGNGRAETLARELKALEKVVKKLVEDVYTDKTPPKNIHVGDVPPYAPTPALGTITVSTNTNPSEVAGLNALVEDLRHRITTLESDLATAVEERDEAQASQARSSADWEYEVSEANDRAEIAEARVEELEAKIQYIKDELD